MFDTNKLEGGTNHVNVKNARVVEHFCSICLLKMYLFIYLYIHLFIHLFICHVLV